jgi:hypothetical protein
MFDLEIARVRSIPALQCRPHCSIIHLTPSLLIALGVKGPAGSGLGRWHLAKSKALSAGLSNKYFS